jgi:hypothetical protein
VGEVSFIGKARLKCGISLRVYVLFAGVQSHLVLLLWHRKPVLWEDSSIISLLINDSKWTTCL